jgi:8-oxo-dGTP pyrophosphatase MutT (NUDIX family)
LGKKERPLFRAAAFVAISNNKGEYLLQRRANTTFLNGYYDLATGHVEHGESYEECAVRETKEECGLTVDESDLRIVALFHSNFEADIYYLNMIFTTSKFWGKPIIGEPNKIDKIDWFLPEYFPSKVTLGTRVFLDSINNTNIKNYNINREKYKELMGEYFE